MHKESLLIVFVKNPEPGKVKTRLAADIGNEKAAEIYVKLVRSIRDNIEALDCDIRISFHDHIGDDEIWSSNRYQKTVQPEGDLGRKMKLEIIKGFKEYKKVCLIGSDIYGLEREHLQEAFHILENNEAVLGPSKDGGYYLIGFREDSFTEKIFDNIPWSTERVLGCTMDKLKDNKLIYRLLPELVDIDTINDLPPHWYQDKSNG